MKKRGHFINVFSLNPQRQGGPVHRARGLGKKKNLSYFSAPKGRWEQNVGDRPQKVVDAGGVEGGAEDHDDTCKEGGNKSSYCRGSEISIPVQFTPNL